MQKSFDETLNEAVHAVLVKMGETPEAAPNAADAMNDNFRVILQNVVDCRDTFPGHTAPVSYEPDFDTALDDATHLVLKAFGIRAEDVQDTADAINDEIEMEMGYLNALDLGDLY